jgi:LmbE family N-acetylglucosaminyl deacetylase
MVTQPHPIDSPGTDEDVWAAWHELDELPDAGLVPVRSAVVVAAHPDDEVLGVGGLIFLLALAGARVRLVSVTDGEGSHRGQADPAALARRRTAETAAALRALGTGDCEVVRLGLPDTGLASREDELAAELSPITEGFDVCLAPWTGDLHPDHEAAGRAAGQAASGSRVSWYPVWMWHWATPGDSRVPWERARRVPLTMAATERKRAALSCFASQTEDRGAGLGPVLSQDMLAHFTRGLEVVFQ